MQVSDLIQEHLSYHGHCIIDDDGRQVRNSIYGRWVNGQAVLVCDRLGCKEMRKL